MTHVVKNGYVDVRLMAYDIIADMLANGFTLVFPAVWERPENVETAPQAPNWTLQAGPTLNALNSTEPWRISIKVYDRYRLGIIVGTPLTLPDNGTWVSDIARGVAVTPMGVVGDYYTAGEAPAAGSPTEGFINRSSRTGSGDPDMAHAFPMSYALTTTPRGFALAYWEDVAGVTAAVSSVVSVQRMVNRDTGAVTNKALNPVWCVNMVGGIVWRFIVREKDIIRPDYKVLATEHQDLYNGIINPEEQIAVSEDDKYVVALPSGLNTIRYAYDDELDILGWTAADVVSQGTLMPVTVYGEERTYLALHANSPDNRKMRLCMLAAGGGATT